MQRPRAPGPDRPAVLRAAALAAVLIVLATPAWSQGKPATGGAPARLDEVERQMEREKARAAEARAQAEKLHAELEQLRRRMIGAARRTQETEQSMLELERRKQEIDRLTAERQAALAERRGQMVALLSALERLASRPPEALLARPGAPEDTVRAGILLRDAVPRIEAMAAALKTEIEDLAALREEAEANARKTRSAGSALERERQRLEALAAEKTRLEQERRGRAEDSARQAERLAAQAKDLRELMEKLEAEREQREQREAAQRRREAAAREAARKPGARPAPDEGAVTTARAGRPAGVLGVPFSTTKGKLPLPARGEVIHRYGEPDGQGQTYRGIVLQTRPQAQIVSAYDGQVVYAGPFRGYGQLLIIEHGEGYHVLLAGLSRIDCEAGQWLLAGEPVGVMGAAGKEGRQLYIELRRRGQPFDPLTWLVASKDKVG